MSSQRGTKRLEADKLEFRVLGPLEVSDGPRRLQLGAPMQRALLGQLLLTAGRTISVEEIAERLWPARPPRRPRNAVQLLVLRVRRALAEFGCDGLIESVPGGYRARTAEHLVDSRTFAELLAEADAAAGRGDTAAERPLLVEALALWRGEVLGEAPSGWQSPAEIEQLEALRLTAIERLAAADIAAGHPERAVPLLRERARQDPGRERVSQLLMLALYQGGQRAEALEAYRVAYRYAVDELGLEPGTELRSLQERILRGDRPGPEATAADTAAPAVLPMRVAGFAGRTGLVEQVRAAVLAGAADGTAVVGLAGMAGVGKSALALHLAYELRDRFPDGQLWAELGGTTSAVGADAVLLRFLRLLGVTDPPADGRAELFRSLSSRRRILVVLDDAAGATQVRALLPTGTGSAVLVTSRVAHPLVDSSRWFGVEPLEPADSVELLTGLVGEQVAAAPESTARVVEWCGGLPLALRIVAGRLAARPSWSMTRLAGQLADEHRRLDHLAVDDRSVRAAIGRSYRSCTPRQRRALSLVSHFPAPWFSAWEVAGLLEEPLDAATEVVEQLVDARLVLVQRPADLAGSVRYRLHDLVRLFAREQPAEAGPSRPTLLRYAAGAAVLPTVVDETAERRRHTVRVLDVPEPAAGS